MVGSSVRKFYHRCLKIPECSAVFSGNMVGNSVEAVLSWWDTAIHWAIDTTASDHLIPRTGDWKAP